MKRTIAIAVVLLAVPLLLARPEYNARLNLLTKDQPNSKQIRAEKCNNCHDGNTKKIRNEFGKAVNKGITAEIYQSLKSDKQRLNQRIDEALKSAMKPGVSK